MLCDCITRAQQRKLKYVGLQYYGECWATNNPQGYNKYGISTLCIDHSFRPCYHANENSVCIGKANTNYVYELEFKPVRYKTLEHRSSESINDRILTGGIERE